MPTPVFDFMSSADVWDVLDLIVAEFQSDPTSTQCFDSRLVARAIALNTKRRQRVRGPASEAARRIHIAINVVLNQGGGRSVPACDGPDCDICHVIAEELPKPALP